MSARISSDARQVKSSPTAVEAVATFNRLVEALERHDFPAATAARKQLYVLGYSVVARDMEGRR